MITCPIRSQEGKYFVLPWTRHAFFISFRQASQNLSWKCDQDFGCLLRFEPNAEF